MNLQASTDIQPPFRHDGGDLDCGHGNRAECGMSERKTIGPVEVLLTEGEEEGEAGKL